MPMPPFIVRCDAPQCQRLAIYKIAARWTDGITAELKTYSLCCADCLAQAYHSAVERHLRCHTTAGETVEHPAVFHYVSATSDQALQPLVGFDPG